MKNIVIVLFYLLISTYSFLKAQPKIIWQKGYEISASDISFSPDSLEMAVVSDFNIIIQNTKTAEVLQSFTVNPGTNLFSVAWSPLGNYIVAASRDSIFYIAPETGKVLQQFPYTGFVRFSPSGKFIIDKQLISEYGGSWVTRKVYTANTFTPLDLTFEYDNISILPGDSAAIISFKDSLSLRRFPSGEIIRNYEILHNQDKFTAFAHHRNQAAIIHLDTLKIFNISSGEITLKIVDDRVAPTSSMEFTPDGKYIVTAGFTLDMWEISTGINFKSRNTVPQNIKLYLPDNDFVYWQTATYNAYQMSSGKALYT